MRPRTACARKDVNARSTQSRSVVCLTRRLCAIPGALKDIHVKATGTISSDFIERRR
jgi:hypothetical protein